MDDLDTGDEQGRGAQADSLRTEQGHSKDRQMDRWKT